jgi:hypothetical protein
MLFVFFIQILHISQIIVFSNHIYWCAASSNGDGEMVQQKYASILNHISNIHEGHGEMFPQCAHDVSEDREWIKQGTKTVCLLK